MKQFGGLQGEVQMIVTKGTVWLKVRREDTTHERMEVLG